MTTDRMESNGVGIELKERTERIFQAIILYKISHHGNSPSIREIGEMAGISSTSVVAYHLKALEKAGLFKRIDRKIDIGGTWQPPSNLQLDIQ